MRGGIHALRPLLGLAGITALLALTAPAAAKPPSPPAPFQDSATAMGDNLPVDPFRNVTDIEVSARSGPSGENPAGRGSFAISNAAAPMPAPPIRISGPVNCLDVSRNTAVLTIAGPFPSLPGVTAFVLRLVDNGGGGRDRFEYFPDDPEVPGAIDCHDYRFDYFGGPLIGRAQVADVSAPPVRPTRRAQCRHKGYIRFGFKNKGRCIRYVRHHRR